MLHVISISGELDTETVSAHELTGFPAKNGSVTQTRTFQRRFTSKTVTITGFWDRIIALRILVTDTATYVKTILFVLTPVCEIYSHFTEGRRCHIGQTVEIDFTDAAGNQKVTPPHGITNFPAKHVRETLSVRGIGCSSDNSNEEAFYGTPLPIGFPIGSFEHELIVFPGSESFHIVQSHRIDLGYLLHFCGRFGSKTFLFRTKSYWLSASAVYVHECSCQYCYNGNYYIFHTLTCFKRNAGIAPEIF